MPYWVMLAFRIVRALFVLYGVLYVSKAVYRPMVFCRYYTVDRPSWALGAHYSREKKWRFYLQLAIVAFAVGALVYFAAFAVTNAIPSNLRALDEDGDDDGPLRMQIHWFVTVVATAFLIAGCEDGAKKNGEREYRERLALPKDEYGFPIRK